MKMIFSLLPTQPLQSVTHTHNTNTTTPTQTHTNTLNKHLLKIVIYLVKLKMSKNIIESELLLNEEENTKKKKV